MSLYKRKDSTIWWISFTHKGNRIQQSSGTSERLKAEEYEAKLRSSMWEQERLGVNPFDDYVVHEAAHIFHNCKRESIGLAASRRREWMLEIDFQKRETFAYSCEAYSRLLELGKTRSARAELLSELAEGLMPADERVNGREYVDILREAVAARNGWKRILERCSSP
jgi:hypothetical protein